MLSGLSRGSLTILTAIVSLLVVLMLEDTDLMVLSGAWDRSCTETVEGTGSVAVADTDAEAWELFAVRVTLGWLWLRFLCVFPMEMFVLEIVLWLL